MVNVRLWTISKVSIKIKIKYIRGVILEQTSRLLSKHFSSGLVHENTHRKQVKDDWEMAYGGIINQREGANCLRDQIPCCSAGFQGWVKRARGVCWLWASLPVHSPLSPCSCSLTVLGDVLPWEGTPLLFSSWVWSLQVSMSLSWCSAVLAGKINGWSGKHFSRETASII